MADALGMRVRFVKGVGDAREKQLARMGVRTVEDLLFFFPRKYEDWSSPVPLVDLKAGETVCVRGTVSFPVSVYRTPGGTLIARTMLTDGPGLLRLVFFNNKYIKEQLKEGETYCFYGKVTRDEDGNMFVMASPAFVPGDQPPGMRAVYPATASLKSRQIGRAVENALAQYGESVPETLPAALIEKYRLLPIGEALKKIHLPENEADIRAARRRLIYEELLILQLGLCLRGDARRQESGCRIETDRTAAFASRLPFALTGAQKRAIAECAADMASGRCMRRLLQGDVGSGKTAVAAALMDTVVGNGYQCALMAPTEVLANQHYETLSRFFGEGVRVALLTGSTPAAARKKLLASLETGETDVLIGTHAVITERVRFHRLALAVTDEQHRFGVRQRASLSEKGEAPHVLVMSATPIPRTLSMIVYGDLDISVLDEKPAGRQPVETYAVTTDYRPRIRRFLRKQIEAGRQAYVVCPLVEEGETDVSENLLSAQQCFDELAAGELKGLPIGLLHGRMKPAEKDRVMRAFSAGDVKLLVCTTVIEVGVDVPNAAVIVVENAERFGLSQLHQLRGRVGRGSGKSICVLVSDAGNDAAVGRLSVMRETDDGFKIAEADLALRGPGDFFGNRQSGLPSMKLADLVTDARILYAAREDAGAILAADPALSEPEHAALRKKTEALFRQYAD